MQQNSFASPATCESLASVCLGCWGDWIRFVWCESGRRGHVCESLLDKDFLFVPAVDKMFLLRYSVGVATLFFMCFIISAWHTSFFLLQKIEEFQWFYSHILKYLIVELWASPWLVKLSISTQRVLLLLMVLFIMYEMTCLSAISKQPHVVLLLCFTSSAPLYIPRINCSVVCELLASLIRLPCLKRGTSNRQHFG